VVQHVPRDPGSRRAAGWMKVRSVRTGSVSLRWLSRCGWRRARAQGLGLSPAALLVHFGDLKMRAPVSHPHRSSRLLRPVGHQPAVGLLDLLGEFAFVALLALVRLRAGALAAARRVAGPQLEPAQLVADGRCRLRAMGRTGSGPVRSAAAPTPAGCRTPACWSCRRSRRAVVRRRVTPTR
jgi:hypothetical protein